MKKGFLLLAMAVFAFSQVDAQRCRTGRVSNTTTTSFSSNGLRPVNNGRTPDLGFGIQVGNPEGAYESVYGGTPVGMGFNASFPLSRWQYNPIELGFDIGTNSMGTTSADLPFVDEFGNQLTHNMDVRSSYNAFHLQARLKPFNGRIKPYGDLLFGTKSHKTVIDNSLEDGFGQFGEQRDVLSRDFTKSYGWAAGIQIELTRHANLDIKMQKLWGGETKFVDQNSVMINGDGTYGYDMLTTPSSNLFVTQVGITFDL